MIDDAIMDGMDAAVGRIENLLAPLGSSLDVLDWSIHGEPIFRLLNATDHARRALREAGYSYGTWRRQGSRSALRGWH